MIIRSREHIEGLLAERGISKVWLASKLGISKQSLNYALNHCKRSIHIAAIYKILEKT